MILNPTNYFESIRQFSPNKSGSCLRNHFLQFGFVAVLHDCKDLSIRSRFIVIIYANLDTVHLCNQDKFHG